MKYIIASDIHGSAPAVRKLICRIEAEAADRIILLGDILYHGPRNDLPEGYSPKEVLALLNPLADKIIAVRGNCDSEVDQMVLNFPCLADYGLIESNDHLLYLTHGHIAGKTVEDPPALKPGSAFLSGHTHIKTLSNRDGVFFVNPGSISIPKDGTASYATFDGTWFTLKTLEGKELQKGTWN